MIQGVAVRFTAWRSPSTKAYCAVLLSKRCSVEMTMTWIGPYEKLYQGSSVFGSGPALADAAFFHIQGWKRSSAATPHSPPLSVPPTALPESGKSRSWLPTPIWYGIDVAIGWIWSWKVSHTDAYPRA